VIGLVEDTTGQTPSISVKSSLAQLEIKAINSIAMGNINLLVFIFFNFRGLNI
jgi:hypothetical protein